MWLTSFRGEAVGIWFPFPARGGPFRAALCLIQTE